jgi:hypothetical protein
MKRLLCVCGIAAGSLSFLASAAKASIVYSYATDLPQGYVGAPGSTVQFKIFSVETVTGSDHSLIVGDNGWNGAGAAVTRISGTATLTSQTLNATPGAGFDGGATLTTKHLTAAGLDFTENVSLAASTGIPGTIVSPGVTEQLLDTVTITLPSTFGTTTSFSLGKNPNGFGSTVSYTSTYNLDADGSTSDPVYVAATDSAFAADGNAYSWTGADGTVTNFTVATTPAPEPASVGLMGIAGLLALRRRRKA